MPNNLCAFVALYVHSDSQNDNRVWLSRHIRHFPRQAMRYLQQLRLIPACVCVFCVVLIVELACATYTDGYHRPYGSYASATNVNQCWKACFDDYSCVAVDWDSTWKQCWTHTKTGIQSTPRHDLHHYDIDRTCWSKYRPIISAVYTVLNYIK